MGLQKHKSVGLLVLRLAAGIIFVMHGYGKLFGNAPGMTAFTGMVDKIGFPMPAFFAYLGALVEFLGGIALILGVWVPVASALLFVFMLVAFFGVKKASFPAADVDFALLAIAFSMLFTGPGRYTVMGMTKKEEV